MKLKILSLIILIILSIPVKGQYYIKINNNSTHFDRDSVALKVSDVYGDVTWQISIDSVNWSDLPVQGNILKIRIDSTAVYRALSYSGNCPVISDTVVIGMKMKEVGNNFIMGNESWVYILPSGMQLKVPENALNENVAIGIFSLSSADIQNLLDSKPFSSIEKKFLGGFIAEPDGLSFNKPVTVKVPIFHTNNVPIKIDVSHDLSKYWISNSELFFNMEDDFVEFNLMHFSGIVIAEKKGDAINCDKTKPGYDCTKCLQFVIQVTTSYQEGGGDDGCYINNIKTETTYLDCDPPYTVTTTGAESEGCEYLDLQINILAPETADICMNTQLEGTVTDKISGKEMNVPLIWNSSNTDAAPIHPLSGILTGIMPGDVIISAKTGDPRHGNASQSIEIVPCEINISPPNTTLNIGETLDLEARNADGDPFYCTLRSSDGTDSWQEPLNWESSWPSVVSILSENEWKAVVQANNEGTAEIKAYYGGASGSASIDVLEEDPCSFVQDYIESGYFEQYFWIRLDVGDGWSDSNMEYAWFKGFSGATRQLSPIVMRWDPFVGYFGPTNCLGNDFLYYSDNESVATVSESGLITLHEGGYTNIRVELINYPSIKTCLVAWRYYCECDKNGDGFLDPDMGIPGYNEYKFCCYNPVLSPDCPCTSCLCNEHFYYQYPMMCKTGETHVYTDCIDWNGKYPYHYNWYGELVWEDVNWDLIENFYEQCSQPIWEPNEVVYQPEYNSTQMEFQNEYSVTEIEEKYDVSD
jgi:hypothetical protein